MLEKTDAHSKQLVVVTSPYRAARISNHPRKAREVDDRPRQSQIWMTMSPLSRLVPLATEIHAAGKWPWNQPK
jgi:hypothetical protein